MPFVKQESALGLMERGGHHNSRPMPKADLIMVFPYKTSALVRWGDASLDEEARGLRPPTDAERHKMETWELKRKGAISALSDSGLVLMLYYSRDRDEVFVRIAADEHHLRQVAEMKQHRLELKPQYLSAFAEYKNDYAGRRELAYRDRCIVSHIYKAHREQNRGQKDGGDAYPKRDAIFRTVDRIQLTDYIVRSSDHHCAGVDVGQLMHDKAISHFFPLHENARLRDLDKEWFKCFCWGTKIDKVRDYFGERIAFYFLFQSHLNKWLILPSIVGLLLWVWDTMNGTPDNKSEVIIGVGMGLWGMLFVHFWRRLSATYALKWGTLGMSVQMESTRPEFTGVSQINPVTGRVDRYYPWSSRIWQVIFSYAVLSLTLVLVIFCVMCLLALRHVNAEHGGSRISFQILNALAVEVLNAAFTHIAKWLTNRENHRSYSEHANHLLAKTVVFKFFNCYVSLYYIAFFKQHSHLFGMPMSCVNDDCLSDLGSQLAIFMIMRLTLLNFIELGLPTVMMWYRNFTEKRTFHTGLFQNPSTVMPDLSGPEKQSKKEDYDLFEDMDEVLMLYGYTTLFVVASPWVPILALVGNMLECFLDQKKLLLLFRRPFPNPAANNEPWDTAFEVFGVLAMLTNAAVIIFSSHAFDGWSHAHKIMLFLAIEHGLIFIRIVVGFAMPAIPREVVLLSMQQQVVVHKHLDLGGDEDDSEARSNAMMTTAVTAPFVHDQDEDEL